MCPTCAPTVAVWVDKEARGPRVGHAHGVGQVSHHAAAQAAVEGGHGAQVLQLRAQALRHVVHLQQALPRCALERQHAQQPVGQVQGIFWCGSSAGSPR